MERAAQATELEYLELAGDLDKFTERAAITDPAALVQLWPELEQRVLDRVGADGYDADNAAPSAANLPRSEAERIRNLAWEIGVSVDLHALHLGALRALAKLLRERGQRSLRRASRDSNARGRASRPDSNVG